MSEGSKRLLVTIIIVALVILSGVLIWQQQQATLVERHEMAGNPMSGMASGGGMGGDDHSIEAHKKMLESNPQDAHALVALGQAYFQQNDWNNAHRYLARSLVVVPNEPSLQYMLGFTLAQKGMYTEAEDYFKRFVEQSKAPIGYLSLGVLYADFLPNKAEAKKAFETVIASKDAPEDMKMEAKKQLELLNKK